MRMFFAGGLCLAARMAAAAGFVWLSPGDRKVSDEYLDEANFAEKAPYIEDYAPKGQSHFVLLQSLKRQGVRIYKRVGPPDEYDTPQIFRVRAGFAVTRSELYDGVYLEDGEKNLSAPFKQALAAAKEDVALVLRMRELMEKVKASTEDYTCWDETRRATRWLWRWDPVWADPDHMRLELGAWIRRFEGLLGEKHGPMPKPADPIAFEYDAKHQPFPEGVALKTVMAKIGADPEPLGDAGDVTFAVTRQGFSVAVKNAKGKVRLGLWTNGAKPDEWRRYDAEVDLAPAPVPQPVKSPGWVPFPERGLFNYVEPRFQRFSPQTWRVVQHAVWGRNYPDIGLSHRVDKSKDGSTRTVTFTAGWWNFWGWWPAGTVGRVDSWRVTVTQDGRVLCDARVKWPKGTDAFVSMYRKCAPGNLEKSWASAVDGARNHWAYSGDDYLYKFPAPKEKELNFHFGDMGSDGTFWHNYCRHFADKSATPDRLRTLNWDLWDERFNFLKTCYAGGPFKKPPKEREKTAAETATAPDIDVSTDELQLDDPE